ncbi:MAG: protein-disulfide reductase DsbD family protein, partial [Planctomycetota bacterium]
EVELRVPAWVAGGEGASQGTIAVRWQTCNDRVCLPPRVTNLTVPLTLLAGGTVGSRIGSPGADQPVPRSGAQKSLDQGFWAFLLAAIMAALVSLATPCVFPMIPITVSFFTKRAESGKGTALRNASAYGVGIVFTFVGLGMGVTALLGAGGANQVASNVWVNVFLAVLFLVFAFSLIGFFDINPPQWLQQRLSRGQAAGQGKGGYLPVMLMAVAFSVTAFTCTVGFVGALLALAAGSGEWTYALFGMSVYAIVFAAPFFLLALFPSALKKLPKAGGWMNTLKVSMGFLELIAAWKFLSNADMSLDLHVLTRPVIIVLTVVPLALLGLYLFGAFRTPHDYEKARLTPLRLLLGGGTLVLAGYIGLGLRGGPFGGVVEAYFPPPQYGQAYEAKGSRILGPVGLEWFENYQEARAVAVEEKKPLFLDFTGVTCVNCRRMEGNIFPDEQVEPLFREYVRAELWVDKGEWAEFNKKLQLDWFHTQAQPFYALLDPRTETVLATYPGYDPDAEKFAAFLRGGLEKYR